MRTKIKLCGLFRPEDIAAANRAGPDYVGFVFAKSRRQVTVEKARQLKALLDPDILAVGVFVDEDPMTIASLCAEHLIDCIQLHGKETEETIAYLQTTTGCPVIKAFAVTGPESLTPFQKSGADYLLFDAKTPGSGRSFDWSLIASCDKPFFLAGGLNLDNVDQAITHCHPYAIDTSSGIETDGIKDPDKMKHMVRKVKIR